MQYTDKLSKGFLINNGVHINQNGMPQFDEIQGGFNRQTYTASRWDEYPDPTYMGFYWGITPNTIIDPNNVDLDYLPQGLFLGWNQEKAEEHSDSAVSYLQRRGEYYRATMMKEFREGMMHFILKEPWVFQSVEGIGELWGIEPNKPFRAGGKKITFTCSESISMRMVYLLDLYRKAAWDATYMRWALPETQRMFTMNLVLTDYRTLQRFGEPFINPTYIHYKLEYCTFDPVLQGKLDWAGNLTTSGTAADAKLVLNVGKVTEINTYGLLGAILADTNGTFYRGKDYARQAFANFTTNKDGDFSAISEREILLTGIKNTENYINNNEERADAVANQNEAAAATAEAEKTRLELAKKALQDILRRLKTGALAALENFVETTFNGAFLGNVYGFSPASLLGNLQELAANPFNTIASVISRDAAPSDVQELASRVELSGPDVKLLNDFIGVVSNVASVVAGTELESASIGDLISGVNASENLEDASPGKVEIVSNGSKLDGLLSKVLFEGSGSLEGSPGKVIFTNDVTSIKGKPRRVPLTSGTSDLVQNDISSKPFTEKPSENLEGEPGNVELE